MKAVSSTKNRANNDDDESRGDTNDEDSNSVDPSKQNGKSRSTAVGASGNPSSKKNKTSMILSHIPGDPNESGGYDDEDDDENSGEDGRFNPISSIE